SMSAQVGDATRWKLACDALLRAAASLPASDFMSVGSFARELRWWFRDVQVKSAPDLQPPRGLEPSGPTNLQAALEQVVTESHGDSPIEMLLLTDAQASIDDPQA